MNIPEKLWILHKNILSKDPIHFFNSKKIISFFKSLYSQDFIKIGFEKEEIIYFSIVIPIRNILDFLIIIFWASFKKSIQKPKISFKNKRPYRGILIYIGVDEEYRGQGIGSRLILSYKKNGYKEIYFVTKEKTYNSFYKNIGTKNLKIFGKCFCHLIL